MGLTTARPSRAGGEQRTFGEEVERAERLRVERRWLHHLVGAIRDLHLSLRLVGSAPRGHIDDAADLLAVLRRQSPVRTRMLCTRRVGTTSANCPSRLAGSWTPSST